MGQTMCKIGIRQPILTAILTAALCLVATTAPTDTDIYFELPAPPDLEDVVILDELVEWVDCGSELGPECWGEKPLRHTIRARNASFELFRNYHDDEFKGRQLMGLPYADEIRAAAERHGVDPLLVAAVVEVESRFDARAVSHRGAMGLMQLLPLHVGPESADELLDPALNLDLGAGYLRWLLELFDGDLELALAAYNAGPTNVRRYDGVPPFRETRNYVQKVLSRYVEHHSELWQSSETGERLALL